MVAMLLSLIGARKKPKSQAPARRGARTTAQAFGPALTEEETTGNLTVLQERLESRMKCPAGKNQVYLRSLLTGRGTTRPRITLKCHLRRDIGLPAEVFYEHIRDVCCADPNRCQAYRELKKRFVPT
jgi:hypothetical protein